MSKDDSVCVSSEELDARDGKEGLPAHWS